MLFSNFYSNDNAKDTSNNGGIDYSFNQKNITNELERILSKIEGAGKVEVMIVFDNNFEKIVAKDTKSSLTDDNGKNNRDVDSTTVMTKEGNKQTPFVVKEIYPSVRGVLVIAEGANNSKVKSEIKNAVKTAFDISIHKVEVLTRKRGG